jgi:hypothetical protein
LEAQHIENLSIPLLKMDNSDLGKRFGFFPDTVDAVERRACLKSSVVES